MQCEKCWEEMRVTSDDDHRKNPALMGQTVYYCPNCYHVSVMTEVVSRMNR